MTARFDLFAIVAGMRTGSNLLEEILSAHPGISCHGELFNPAFVGAPGQDGALGIARRARDEDPTKLLAAVAAIPDAIGGFRIFDGHDERAIEAVLSNPRCAKIVLTRNPAESYVSLKIAQSTGQWWLGDRASARRAKARFDAEEFGRFLEASGAFRRRVLRALQVTGQTAFHLDYADLADAEVIAGLHAFLGVPPLPRPHKTRSKAQNPAPLAEKVTNPKVMRAALARIDLFDIDRIPGFEPPRGAGVPGFRVADGVPVMFMPVGLVAQAEVDGWLRAVGGGAAPQTGLSQQDLRAWMRRNPGHRRITVVEHPATRIHDAFSRVILPKGVPGYEDLRDTLVHHQGVPLPDDPSDPGYDGAAHRAAFLAFLDFVRGNLGGQTGLRPHASWASQASLLSAISGFAPPDLVLRREDLARSLDRLADDLGLSPAPLGDVPPSASPVPVEEILDDVVNNAVAAAYRRDFVHFGYARIA
ncbi:nodulation protein NodH [Palleronia sp. KMU-117]|uniref:nodulation protein NodH n=1 Tax=Palleronia sp. KMU-117 TaxID=3434108 RepID=UPI003D70F9D1